MNRIRPHLREVAEPRPSDATSLAAFAAMTAARELACEDGPERDACIRLADDLERAMMAGSSDPRDILAVGPRSVASVGPGMTLVEMLVRDPGINPIRTAKLLLRAVRWAESSDRG